MSNRQISLGERYVNPFTDFGFKRLFGEEPNKALLIDFLNEVLMGQPGIIQNVTYLKTEHLGTTVEDRKSIFDIYCENEKGEKFIVELQKVKHQFFKDRALYYTTFPIREQAQRGEWNFELQAVYTIAILDFSFDDSKEHPNKYRSDVKLIDQKTKEVFYDKLTFIYFEMPKFTKTLDELDSKYEKWLYVLRHLSRLDSIPEKLQERIFEQLFEVAEVAKFNREQVLSYEDSLKAYRDLRNALDTARQEGREEGHKKGLQEGRKEERTQIAINLLRKGMPAADISKITHLSELEIQRCKQKL